MSELADALAQLARHEGLYPTLVPGIRVFRCDHPSQREPLCYSQGIIFVAQGVKRVHLEGRVYEYSPSYYLALPLPTPAECETLCRPDQPLLSLVMDLDLTVLHEVVRVLDEHRVSGGRPHSEAPEPLSLFVAPVTEALSQSLLRLACALQDPVKARVLGAGLIREVLLHVLQGPNGASLIDLVRHNTHLARLEPVLRHMHAHYAEPVDVGQLARLASMSPASFHRNFRRATSISPIQYIKRIRLTRAREILLDQGIRVGEAAAQVGYESPSQFSREFKRYFGQPPQAALGQSAQAG